VRELVDFSDETYAQLTRKVCGFAVHLGIGVLTAAL
jgi:hypothetical protein